MTTALRQRMHQDLQLAGLAEGTQKAYLRAVRQMAAHFKKPPDQVSESELREYLVYRQYWATHRHPIWLFPATGRDHAQARAAAEPMARASVHGAIKRVVQALGFRKRITIHTLRHTYATHLLEAGVNLRIIQQQESPSDDHGLSHGPVGDGALSLHVVWPPARHGSFLR